MSTAPQLPSNWGPRPNGRSAHSLLAPLYDYADVTDDRLADLESRSGTSVAGSVATFADLPAGPNDGQSWIVRDEIALYTWSEDANDWVGPVPVQGAATDAAVSGVVGNKSTATRTVLDHAYFFEGDTPPALPVVGQRWMDTSDDSLMVPSPTTQIGDRWIVGVVPPNGAVTAPVGTRYTDTARTAGALEWIKETGSGNTGWRVVVGDTGVRDITTVLAPERTAGRVLAHRVGVDVTVIFDSLRVPAGASSWTTYSGNLPEMFRPHTSYGLNIYLPSASSGTASDTTGAIRVTSTSGGVISYLNQDKIVRAVLTYRTDRSWPTVLPGTPA